MISKDEIVQHALALPADDRAFLADLLEESLPHSKNTDPEYAQSWTTEINRRVEAYRRGETHANDAATAMQNMLNHLADRVADRKP